MLELDVLHILFRRLLCSLEHIVETQGCLGDGTGLLDVEAALVHRFLVGAALLLDVGNLSLLPRTHAGDFRLVTLSQFGEFRLEPIFVFRDLSRKPLDFPGLFQQHFKEFAPAEFL